MTIEKGGAGEEARIRECIEEWARAVRAKDVDGVASYYTPDVRAFDLAPPLEHVGKEYTRGFASVPLYMDGSNRAAVDLKP